jgi:transposase-like protein
MAMARGERDRGKERFWRRMVRQWQRSGLSVRDYCLEHRLAESAFYFWRRTISDRNQQANRQRRHDGQQRARRHGPPLFVPLTVAAAAVFEVVLSDGRVVRVPAGFDPATLRQLLAVLDEASPC